MDELNQDNKAVKENTEELLNKYNFLLEQNNNLSYQLKEIQKSHEESLNLVVYLASVIKQQEYQKQLQEQKKLARKKAQKKPVRQVINPDEFLQIIDFVDLLESQPFIASRTKIALFILYFTGIRISNLLEFYVKNLYDLMYSDEAETQIRLMKNGKPNFLVSIGTDAQHLLKTRFYKNVLNICQDKEESFPLFTSPESLNKLLNRVNLNKGINKILKYAFQKISTINSC